MLRSCLPIIVGLPWAILVGCGGEPSPHATASADSTASSSAGVTTGSDSATGYGATTTSAVSSSGLPTSTTTGSGGAASIGGTSTTGASDIGGQSASSASGGAGSTDTTGSVGAGGATGGGTTGGTTGGGTTGGDTGSVRWVGRVDASNPAAIRFAWQGAGFVGYVSGDTVAVTLRTEGTDAVYFQPLVDGVMGARFSVNAGADQTITLATNLSPGNHVVELYRETEGYYGVSTFLGFASGTPMGAPPSSSRVIEVVGDSISAGYGNLGVEPHPGWVADPACHWTAENSSWYLTYAALAGHALGADVSTVARSGYGMYRDLDGNSQGVLSSVYNNTLGFASDPPWSFPAQVDAVVINLGTNDWSGGGDPGVAYETAYVEFLAGVRSHYPEAWIFLTIGSMLNEPELSQVTTHLDNIVTQVQTNGDPRVSSFDFGSQDLGSDGSIPSGCDWHPSTDEHARMAGILQAELEDKLGW